MANEFWLSDGRWTAIEPLLPGNRPGARRVDDRRVISGIVHVLKRLEDISDAEDRLRQRRAVLDYREAMRSRLLAYLRFGGRTIPAHCCGGLSPGLQYGHAVTWRPGCRVVPRWKAEQSAPRERTGWQRRPH
jgi:transposase